MPATASRLPAPCAQVSRLPATLPSVLAVHAHSAGHARRPAALRDGGVRSPHPMSATAVARRADLHTSCAQSLHPVTTTPATRYATIRVAHSVGRELATLAAHVRHDALRDGGACSPHPMSATSAARYATLRTGLARSPCSPPRSSTVSPLVVLTIPARTHPGRAHVRGQRRCEWRRGIGWQ